MNQELIRQEVFTLLEETFEQHHGIYTNKGTSLFETLAGIDAVVASRVLPGLNESIAGHVFHTAFYVRVLLEYIRGTRTGKTNWDESWVLKTVSPSEWKRTVEGLREQYEALISFQNGVKDWLADDNLGGMMAVIAHCAYHLGAIRQLKDLV